MILPSATGEPPVVEACFLFLPTSIQIARRRGKTGLPSCQATSLSVQTGLHQKLQFKPGCITSLDQHGAGEGLQRNMFACLGFGFGRPLNSCWRNPRGAFCGFLYHPKEEQGVRVHLNGLGTLDGTFGISRAGLKYLQFRGVPYAAPPVGDLRSIFVAALNC